MWLSRCHVTTKKHPVAASQLPQQNLTPEVTQGHQESSLWLVHKCLAQAVITQSRAADATGLGTPTRLGMSRQ